MSTEQFTKRCTHCGETKPTDEFYKRSASKDGLQTKCKACMQAKQQAYYEANKEERKRSSRAYYEANKDKMKLKRKEYREANAERIQEYQRRYLEANRERLLLYWREYRQVNKEKCNRVSREYHAANRTRLNALYREYHVEYYKANKVKYAERDRRRRAAKQNASGSHTFDDVWQMYEDQDGLCAYCETPLFGTFEVDHMNPLSRGGSDDWSNLAISCRGCNRSKKARTVEEFVMRNSCD